MDNINIALIYNLLVGSNDRLLFQKVNYAIGLLKQKEVLEGLRHFDDFEEVITFALKQRPSMFNNLDFRAIKDEVNHDLALGMLEGIFNLDPVSVDAYYQENFLEMNEAIKLGQMIVHVSEKRLKEIFDYRCKKIVVLDAVTMGDDLSFDALNEFGELIVYDTTSKEETLERIQGASYVFTNKVVLDESILSQVEGIEYIGILATGTNNVDLAYCMDHGIVVRNVAGYSTDTVAEHTLAVALNLTHKIQQYDAYVKSKQYSTSNMFTAVSPTFYELKGKIWGIIGLGAIGRKVAELVNALGCKIQYYSPSGNRQDVPYDYVDFETLLKTSDIISIHAPLNDHTYHLIDQRAINKMKKNAYLINVGRGPIVKEDDLVFALKYKMIAGASLDVYENEPLSEESKLLELDNVILTPHSAWASFEARSRLLYLAIQYLKEYIDKNN